MISARILVVEDDRIVARDIQQQLARMGHTVVGLSASGEDAIRIAGSQQPDLVLMDIRLDGEMDGIEAARRIRDQHHIPIVFLTAYANDETVHRASLTEPFGYLLKPFEEPQMRTVIQMALYKHASDAKLRMGERRYAATLASIRDGVILCDNHARIDFMNRVAETMTGWSAVEAVGQPLAAVFAAVDEETRERLETFASLVLRTGNLAPPERLSTLVSRSGSEIVVEERCSVIIDDRGGVAGAVLVFSDMTQRRQIAEALRQAQADLAHVGRLTTMGELAAAVAHEVSQPLMAIVTNAGTCLQHLSRPQPDLAKTRTVVERIVRDAQRAGDVVRSIHALARRTPADPGWVDLNALITDTLTLVRAELRRAKVEVTSNLLKGSPWVHGDRVQLQQLVLNLVMNAIEAMTGLEQRERRITIASRSRDGRIHVSVEDTGVGIAQSDTEAIFKALFTTKPKGLGMGLSISRSIVELHGGQLTAAPRQPCGSRFEFVLPVAAPGAAA
ncbi:response regulator [Azospirillum sp. TSO35-2]|uniref:response regulator n=1 Tax=Azospirillum sp. TSO35-2 TaxID=716796 RepID=UPI000D61D124|nr:response regulator [Azospirillum sp. TSO35-2]PWC31068.1 histidine kinase [Azospirillum sp. TSO35-2]